VTQAPNGLEDTEMAQVSTIIPVYNGERTVAKAIDSALAQNFDNHEIIVVNDGSADSTQTILNGYKDRVKVLCVSNGGVAKARNVGVAASSGKYVAFLDADDSWMPEKLKIMIPAIEANSWATLAFSDFRQIDTDGNECGEMSFGRAPSLDELLTPRIMPILPSTWLLRREIFDRIGGFDERFPKAGLEDIWVAMLLRELGDFLYVPQSLTIYFLSGGMTADKYEASLHTFIALLNERYGSDAARWIRNVKDAQCRDLFSKIAHQMDEGDRLGALLTLARIAWFHPTYLLGAQFRTRLVAPQNLKRAQALTRFFYRPHSKSQERAE
jgi:glycosyltransferase involved in cell wall biosynthesis